MARIKHKRQASPHTYKLRSGEQTPRDGVMKQYYRKWKPERDIKSKAYYLAQEEIKAKLLAKALEDFLE